ncbi:MAG: hypothetical protein K2X93_25590 [Candidatus Obscuribacterales bacterium]|nr:hypothetical protein [Candidatus Obscuribacterales bacterium]
MKNKVLALVAASALAISTMAPAMAADDTPLGSVGALMGATSAVIVDVPEGILWHSLWNCPLKTTQYLAEAFGDSNGLGQNLVGGALGIPAGFLWGIPYGAIAGGRHGMTVGWDKPFSTESYLVMGDEK